MQVGLADKYRACLPQMRDRRSVLIGRRRGRADRGCSRGHRPAQVEQVLDGNRHTMKRAPVVSCGELAVGLSRLLHGFFRQYQCERIELGIPRANAGETALGCLFRRDLARAKRAREFRHGHRLTEIATPSRSGTIDVSNDGCAWICSLYATIALVSAAFCCCGVALNPGTTSPLHNTLSVTSRPPGRSRSTRASSIGPYCFLSPS